MEVIFWKAPDGTLAEMRPAPYDSEAVLQQLLAEHPSLLVAGRSDLRLLLIAREQGVPDQEGAYDRWSLDHLFVDSQAVPTLVEVKRATDTRIRREVVGQMLDYAANGVKHWPQGSLRERYEKTAGGLSQAEELFAEFAPGDVMEEFWNQVETNLRAGVLRLVFVADRIPDSLRRIIEFLNEQMDRTEVIGVEVEQYVGDEQVTLVPRILGRTTAAQRLKPRGGSYESDVAEGERTIREAAERLDEWAATEGINTRMTRRSKQFIDPDGAFLFQFYPMFGTLEVSVHAFAEAGRIDLRDEVREAFQALTGNQLSFKNLQVPIKDVVANWPSFVGQAVPALRRAKSQIAS